MPSFLYDLFLSAIVFVSLKETLITNSNGLGAFVRTNENYEIDDRIQNQNVQQHCWRKKMLCRRRKKIPTTPCCLQHGNEFNYALYQIPLIYDNKQVHVRYNH